MPWINCKGTSMPHDSGRYSIQLRVRAAESDTPLLSDTSNFLYDFNVAYELARLATDPLHKDFTFTHFAFFRNGRPLRRDARLEVVRLREESPLDLLVQVAAANGALTAVWLLLQIVEKAFNLKLNRRKLRAEVEKLERDNREAARRNLKAVDQLEQEGTSALKDPDAAKLIDSATKRLTRGSIRIVDIELTVQERQRDHE